MINDAGVPLVRQEAWRVPTEPGVYAIFDGTSALYVGRATDLRARFVAHARRSHNQALARAIQRQALRFTYQPIFTSGELERTERNLIRELGPACNRVLYHGSTGTRGGGGVVNCPKGS